MMTLNDAQEAGRMASMKDQGNGDDGHIAGSDNIRDELAEEMA